MSTSLSSAIKNALSTLQSLAFLPEAEGQLTSARQDINNIVDGLNGLDDIRHSARGIIDLYETVSVLEALDIGVSYSTLSNGRPDREFYAEFTNAQVLPGRLDPQVSNEQFASMLFDAYTGYGPDHLADVGVDIVETGTCLFSDDLVCLYAAADPFGDDIPDVTHTIKTTRSQVIEAIESAGVDGVAQALFPGAWNRAARTLGLDETDAGVSSLRPKP